MECRPPRKIVQFVENEGELKPTVITVPDLADHPLGKCFHKVKISKYNGCIHRYYHGSSNLPADLVI